MKPNYKTSEFWFTLATVFVSILYLVGIIEDHDQKEDIIDSSSQALEAIFLLGGQALVLYKYIGARSEQKKAQADVELAKEIAKQIALHEEKKKNDQHRTHKD